MARILLITLLVLGTLGILGGILYAVWSNSDPTPTKIIYTGTMVVLYSVFWAWLLYQEKE